MHGEVDKAIAKEPQGAADEPSVDIRPVVRFSRRVRRAAIVCAAASFALWGTSVLYYFEYTHDDWSFVIGEGTVGLCFYNFKAPNARSAAFDSLPSGAAYGIDWPEYDNWTAGVSIVSLPFWLPSLLFSSIAAWLVTREQRRTDESGRCRCCGAAGLVKKRKTCMRCRRVLRYGQLSLVLIIAAAFFASRPMLNSVSAIVGVWFFGLTLLFVLPQAVRFARGSKTRSSRYCPKCAYDLTGNTSGICPECGTRIFSKRDHGVTHTT